MLYVASACQARMPQQGLLDRQSCLVHRAKSGQKNGSFKSIEDAREAGASTSIASRTAEVAMG
jgi:hypothetical protein